MSSATEKRSSVCLVTLDAFAGRPPYHLQPRSELPLALLLQLLHLLLQLTLHPGLGRTDQGVRSTILLLQPRFLIHFLTTNFRTVFTGVGYFRAVGLIPCFILHRAAESA